MEYIKLGNSDLHVSRICLGCMGFGDASSGISGVVADCKRLVPEGNYFSENLWINHSNHSRRATLIQYWLTAINYNTMTAIDELPADAQATPPHIYSLDGRQLEQEPQKGIYIKNGKKIVR